jgi:hypothetical protein
MENSEKGTRNKEGKRGGEGFVVSGFEIGFGN